jgi:hypothetical protein
MVHTVSRHGELQIVQSLGEGMASLPLPNPKLQNRFECMMTGDDMCKIIEERYPKGNMTTLAILYDLSASGVAVFDRPSGILTERVWQVSGAGRLPGEKLDLPPYSNHGRLRMLGRDDHPDVGPTHQVAGPGAAVEGLEGWRPLQSG